MGMLSQIKNNNAYKNKEIPSWDGTHSSLENLLDRNFDNPFPFNVLCTDRTYLFCKGVKAYMSAVIDATTNKIIAYKISTSLRIEFVVDTINEIPTDMLNDESLIQSDQGTHYTSPIYCELVAKLGLT